MVQGHISCCDYWGGVGVVSVKKLIAVFEILEHYRTKKAGLPPSGSAACLLFVWSTYSKLTGWLFMQPYTLQTRNG